MRDLPLKKLRNFGGKLGAELGEMQCTTAGEVAALPHKALVAKFGEERATFIARAVRGYSDEPVQARAPPPPADMTTQSALTTLRNHGCLQQGSCWLLYPL